MDHSKSSNLKRLNIYGMIVVFIITLAISICGYLTAPLKTPGLILYREALGDTDYMMTIGKLLICFLVAGEFSVTFNSMRLSFFEIYNNGSSFSNKEYVFIL